MRNNVREELMLLGGKDLRLAVIEGNKEAIGHDRF